jgi:predicted phosphodiesterase
MRIFALSDIHVDYGENMAWIRGLSDQDYRRDVLLLAGDACHEMTRLRHALECLRRKFAEVFFLNGNHELWLLDSDCSDSLQKFHRILDLCRDCGIRTEPAKMVDGHAGVWIVPLFGWYDKVGVNSLFLPKPTLGKDPIDSWADDHFVRWPRGGTASTYFFDSNLPNLDRTYDASVISFSHFLPRTDLMFPPQSDGMRPPTVWPVFAGFNFSRVAGTWLLEKQIRKLGSQIHVYGHQHRNRWVTIDDVHYVSHCLGYPHERKNGRIGHFEPGPRLIWEHGRAAVRTGA